MPSDNVSRIVEARVNDPGAIATAAARRVKASSLLGAHGKAMIVAADHPARGANGVGAEPTAMADRFELLDRLCTALERPGVTGVLGTADILEDLLLLGVLDGKSVFGSMNRAGLAGSVFEIDDRFTGYDAETIAAMGFDGGKMLTRIALDDPATPSVLENTARAVNELNDRQLIAMVEPFLSEWQDGRIRNDLSTDAVIKSITIASGLGRRTAYTWLKLPVVADMERVLASSTLPALLLGGEVKDPEAAFASWGKALKLPTAQGLMVGRSLLYPSDGDVAGAVDRAVNLL
ncbi:aldolase [Streptomyces sp. NBC_00620]|uniref:Cgl0159 family (beta/alpha)8-fold protein n=1 Tax=unclassified Streptomyces TaxID=2593676 RepID=UPI0022536428|nr:aldolase [Streptomyces sp. NBC_00620]MCX4976569.1 aldolase [Streptomyces sp. NBC_00620]WUC09447.1 aldolase [Streptomyces sp. NBC_00564]WUC54232.1 aldolase [Streptomyces sp. NBC_00554]